jgi:hypothetical protein
MGLSEGGRKGGREMGLSEIKETEFQSSRSFGERGSGAFVAGVVSNRGTGDSETERDRERERVAPATLVLSLVV